MTNLARETDLIKILNSYEQRIKKLEDSAANGIIWEGIRGTDEQVSDNATAQSLTVEIMNKLWVDDQTAFTDTNSGASWTSSFPIKYAGMYLFAGRASQYNDGGNQAHFLGVITNQYYTATDNYASFLWNRTVAGPPTLTMTVAAYNSADTADTFVVLTGTNSVGNAWAVQVLKYLRLV